MAQDANSGKDLAAANSSSHDLVPEDSGTGVVSPDAVKNPGHPEHRKRVTDLDPKKEKQAERTVFVLFFLSAVGSLWAVAAYMMFPIDGQMELVRSNNLFIGLGATLALMALGIGAVHWGKAIMADHESVDERHPVRGTDETRARAIEIFEEANEESGFGRRALIRNSLIGALVVFPLPAVALFRGLAPYDEDPVELLQHTMWKKGTRLARDPSGVPIKASDVTLGSAFHVIPEDLNTAKDVLNEKAKAIVLLMRLKPEDLNELPERKNWSYNGIVAYSKVCTHVGCPVALYEQQTHHLLCPCHQSQFDVANHATVIFGPAARPLPQLPIEVDDEGYLVAQSDFTEPVGPSFWERH
ncbi:ubiquinol-cytochrome c reductase iron-sulfur subunit [Mycetocola tolaasinivorans]|uniref:Cytochrome bc1 complex Rieske iron-sulfur subunit n=1 Tax=Mycetocola tolaasinivorans TaxID=76635 RepID=A0A3L7ACH5_9MICO|nr:ubiquinol-cytochrome c reductase iron-sulfur subunit [Mycetocola tolaasinivorans]RLP78089.1 ubiquinol-cytochrome c reductase iron-sulfur subunit [Mycetocola tolaasinivorans]